MKTEKHYIGITLGPIDRIMSYTQSTKSLWRASYFMSYVGKQLITEFFNMGRTFLKPQLNKEMWNLHDGVGRFPDQYIFEAKEGDYKKMLAKRDEVLQYLGEKICLKLENEDELEDVVSYLKDSLKIYILQFTTSPEEVSIPKQNSYVVEACQQAMSVMECRDQFPLMCKCNYLAKYFETNIHDDFLVDDAFGKSDRTDNQKNSPVHKYNGYRLFKSIIEITAREALEEDIISKKEIFKDKQVAELGTKYKYIAFVSADGDNVGKTIAKLGTDMSNMLWEYSKGLTGKVEKYGGKVIYSGGDDLVLFAPAVSVFQLIDDINSHFEKLLKENEIEDKLNKYDKEAKSKEPSQKPTLSFGVSISYYKYPMRESISQAESLLWQAKNEGRNRIAWTIRKHSGQSIESRFNKKDSALYKEAMGIIEKYALGEKFLYSFGHYLLLHQEILTHILTESTNAAEMLSNYLDSTFEDGAHRNHADMLGKLENYLLHLSEREMDKAEAVQKLHALLRYIELFTIKEK